LEHYLTAVLGFGAQHSDALVNLDTLVRKRVLKNAKLHKQLAEGLTRSGGTTIPFDPIPLEKLFAMIAKGLLWYHWQTLLEPGYAATSAVFSALGESLFNQMFNGWNTPRRVKHDLGDGTFYYEGAQATDCPQCSIWRFSMYGGVVFGDDSKQPGSATLAVAVTGPDGLIQRLQSKLFAG